MKTINNEFIRNYDNLKQDIFHAKKQQHKNNIKSKMPKIDPIKLKIKFPWRTLIKLTSLIGICYCAYNYTQDLIDYSIKQRYLSILDILTLKTLKQDFVIKTKTLIKKSNEVKNLSHFSNYVFKDHLQKDFLYLKKSFPQYIIKSVIQSNFKIWIFQFHNVQKSQYLNEFGDIIQREQTSFLRIWKYPILKDRKQKVLKQQKIHNYYRSIMQKRSGIYTIGKEIAKQCEKINILNVFSQQHKDLVIQCRKYEKIGQKIANQINERKKLFNYPSLDTGQQY